MHMAVIHAEFEIVPAVGPIDGVSDLLTGLVRKRGRNRNVADRK